MKSLSRSVENPVDLFTLDVHRLTVCCIMEAFCHVYVIKKLRMSAGSDAKVIILLL